MKHRRSLIILELVSYVILGISEILRSREENSENNELLNAIVRNLQKLLRLAEAN
jgi:hypothetical protein